MQNAIPGLKPRIPGCRFFFDGEDGHQTFRKRTRLGVEGVRGGQKVCSCPRLGELHGGQNSNLLKNMLWGNSLDIHY